VEEVPDIVARICGICPIAYQMSAVQAIEQALGITVSHAHRELRRLFYCGEWIESHALHVALLHAPDFLGYADGLAMAKDHGELVKQALQLKKAGNHIVKVIGGREIHPVSACAGGFYRVPAKEELDALIPELEHARQIALRVVDWVAKFNFPDFEADYDFVALSHPEEYAIDQGRIASNRGLDIGVAEFDQHFQELHVAHSNALQCVLRERGPYMVGPLARFNLNFDRLPQHLQELALGRGLWIPCLNPFRSIIVRGIETVYACEEALRLIAAYQPPQEARVPLRYRAGVGHGCTEAPRGLLYHRYDVDAQGTVVTARIIPPTSQNQKRMEEDLRQFVPQVLSLPQEELTWRCEQAVRNYDPCISCATHFLEVTVQQR
jgi:coenzyme F420-reducing hydrogenase alpha subunit